MSPRILMVTLLIGLTLAHVRLRTPPSRSSLWRDRAFRYQSPPNYDDDASNCGHVRQWEESKWCGICGDHFKHPKPRPNETGGTFGRGIIVAKYKPGQIIEIKVQFTTTHEGYFQMQICDKVPESEDCFVTLEREDGSTRWVVNEENNRMWVNSTLPLPPNLQCAHCVLRFHYRAGNNWGICKNGRGRKGCNRQETFRHCSDISILPTN